MQIRPDPPFFFYLPCRHSDPNPVHNIIVTIMSNQETFRQFSVTLNIPRRMEVVTNVFSINFM